MRETKDQKIIRLEKKVGNLEAELKIQKSITKKQIKDLKDVQKESNSQTQIEFEEQLKKLKNENKELQYEYKKLWDKYYTTILRNSRSKNSALFSIYKTLRPTKLLEWLLFFTPQPHLQIVNIAT